MSIIDKIAGRAKQALGDIMGNRSLHQQGRLQERKGEAKDELARAKAEADRAAAEVERRGA